MDRVPELAAAGVTDFRVNTNLPDGASETADLLSGVADAFRSARRAG